MEIEGVYSFSGFIRFLKGCDLHFCSLPLCFLRNAKPVGEESLALGRFPSAAPICITGGGSLVLPTPANCLQGNRLSSSQQTPREMFSMVYAFWPEITPCRLENSSCVPQQRSQGTESGLKSVNPMCCKEKIKGRLGTKWLFQSFQLV